MMSQQIQDGGLCHLENRLIVWSPYLNNKSADFDFDEIWYTTADLEVDDSHVTKYENF